jgi:chaperonin GroEL (HSP60 family)
VTTTALANAVSVATVLISTNCVITDTQEDDDDEAGMDDMDM